MAWVELLTTVLEIESIATLLIVTQITFYFIAIYSLLKIKELTKNNSELKDLTEKEIRSIKNKIDNHDKELKNILMLLYKIEGKLEAER